METPQSVTSSHFKEAAAFRLLLENVTDYAILLMDAQRRVTTWNIGAQHLLGYTEQEMLGQSADLIFTPEDRAVGKPEQEAEQARQRGRAEDERWHIRKDGSRFWGSGVMTCLRDEAGQEQGFAKILRDRTAGKIAEQEQEQTTAQQVQSERRSAVTQERRRMAQELHDTLAQYLTGIKLQLDLAEDLIRQGRKVPAEAFTRIERARENIAASLVETRRILEALRLTILEENELTLAFEQMVEQITRGTDLAVRLEVEGDPYALPIEVESDLFRIGQQALINSMRHAGAARITIQLHYRPDRVQLRVQDDGTGFDPQLQTVGFGLTGMRERAQRIGAELTVRSQPGSGTEVLLTLPTASSE